MKRLIYSTIFRLFLCFQAGCSMMAVNSQSLEDTTTDVCLIDPNEGQYSIEIIQQRYERKDYWWEINNPLENIENYGLTSYLQLEKETMMRIGAEQPSSVIDTIEAPAGLNIKQTNDTVRTIAPAKQVLAKVRTKIKSIETVLKKAAIDSYYINGKIDGLRISGLEKILVAKELLLKSGDIIRVVNGQPLSSKIRAYKIFKKARKLSTMKIELLRDGKSQTLLYYLR
ncbi:MAG: hypothetical protein FVQ85_12360 [Planctomycetes bacterium]|nr:hypothetical protein [Planctomycetota bacterium]